MVKIATYAVFVRSDVSAGEQFGSALAVELMQYPVFNLWFNAAKSELKEASLAR